MKANESRPNPIAREQPLKTPIAFGPAQPPKDAVNPAAAAGLKEKSQPKLPCQTIDKEKGACSITPYQEPSRPSAAGNPLHPVIAERHLPIPPSIPTAARTAPSAPVRSRPTTAATFA